MTSASAAYNGGGLYYRMAENGPPILRQVLAEKGWLEYVEGEAPYWNLWWKGSRYRKSEYEGCSTWQRLNHFPKTGIITRKDSMFRCLRTMSRIHGSLYHFTPQTFILPKDYTKFVRVYASEEEGGRKSAWICKPAGSSRGRGIVVFSELGNLSYNTSAVLQRYITNPLLIDGYKFDIRAYVYVQSFSPLVVYMHDEGLTRFATNKYDMSSLHNVYSHLTNTSINKFSSTLTHLKGEIGPGCKWTLGRLREYFRQKKMDFNLIWKKIEQIVILTLLPLAQTVPIAPGCFELYGFDILVDETMKPWLLEVNFSPALNSDCDVDTQVKKPLMEDTIALLSLDQDDVSCANKAVETAQQDSARKRRRRRPLSEEQLAVSHQDVYGSRSSLKWLATSSDKHSHGFTPKKIGGFTQIFPFNDATENLSTATAANLPIPSILSEIRALTARERSARSSEEGLVLPPLQNRRSS